MSENKIKVGGIVRFLNAIGGGRVARIVKDMAYVEDEDGFEIPTPLSQCVLVAEGDTFVPAYKLPKRHRRELEGDEEIIKPAPKVSKDDFLREVSHYSKESRHPKEESEKRPLEAPLKAPHTFIPAKGEVELLLAFLAEDLDRLGQTNFETYLVNDCDYSLYYVYSISSDGEKWQLKGHGYVRPNTKVFVGEFASEEMDNHLYLNLQIIALAENPGIYKASYSLSPKIEGRLSRTKNFAVNPFFDERAYVLPLVVSSLPKIASTDVSKEALLGSLAAGSPKVARSTKTMFAPREERVGIKSLGKESETIVVDLHASELLEHMGGMNAVAILEYQIDYFRKVMDAQLGSKGKKLIFIHGKGNGTLRSRILRELRRHYPRCKSQDASFVEYGYGATQITIY